MIKVFPKKCTTIPSLFSHHLTHIQTPKEPSRYITPELFEKLDVCIMGTMVQSNRERPGSNIKLHVTLRGWSGVNHNDWQGDMVIMDHETRRCLMHAAVHHKCLRMWKPHTACVQQILCLKVWLCLCPHLFVCTCVSVQDASVCLWYFTFQAETK